MVGGACGARTENAVMPIRKLRDASGEEWDLYDVALPHQLLSGYARLTSARRVGER